MTHPIRWTAIGAIAAAAAWTLALPGVPVARADDPEPKDPPYPGEGDLAFSVDLAGFRSAPGETEQEIYLAVSNDQLAFEPVAAPDGGNGNAKASGGDGKGDDDGGPLEGELKLQAHVRTRDGDDVATFETVLKPQAASRGDAKDRSILQVIREKVTVPPGVYHLDVTLTDLRSQKIGLFNRMRHAKNKGRVDAWIRVGSFDSPSLALSDLALVRNARRVNGNADFGRNGVDFDPNPSRYYGLILPAVTYYLETYSGKQYEPGDSFLVVSGVHDMSGGTLVEKRSRAVPDGPAFVLTDAVDLSEKIGAGRYQLAVEVTNERTHQTVQTERTFDVLWSVGSWGQDPGDMLEEMALIMTDREYDTLESLSPGAREVYLAEFWHKLDPTPDTPENETLDKFRRRVRLANRNYGQTLRRGVLTDRGRVLVRYGIPDEVDYQYSSSSFGPDAGQQKVSEPGERVDLSNRPSPSFLSPEEFRQGDVSGLATQRGSATIKSKELEIWTYDGRGSPLRPDHQDVTSTSHRGLKFIFADEMGNGEYQLVGSQGATVY